MNKPAKISSLPSLKALTEDNNTLRLKIKGPLNAYTTAKIWNDSLLALKSTKKRRKKKFQSSLKRKRKNFTMK